MNRIILFTIFNFIIYCSISAQQTIGDIFYKSKIDSFYNNGAIQKLRKFDQTFYLNHSPSRKNNKITKRSISDTIICGRIPYDPKKKASLHYYYLFDSRRNWIHFFREEASIGHKTEAIDLLNIIRIYDINGIFLYQFLFEGEGYSSRMYKTANNINYQKIKFFKPIYTLENKLIETSEPHVTITKYPAACTINEYIKMINELIYDIDNDTKDWLILSEDKLSLPKKKK